MEELVGGVDGAYEDAVAGVGEVGVQRAEGA